LLLADTDLHEPTFRRTVIYIVEHNDGGTLGVVLNRPSETAVYNVLPQWAKLAAKPKTMFIGGPVKRDAALCLAVLRVGAVPDGVPGLRHVAGRMAMSIWTPTPSRSPRWSRVCGSSPATPAGRSDN
jgi:putative transcriptional regulator